MTRWLLSAVALVTASVLPFIALAQAGPAVCTLPSVADVGWSRPEVSGNLTVFFFTPAEATRSVTPGYTLFFEALRAGDVVIHETGNVNRLSVENRSDRDVFVHQGDVVKGGKQDRVLATDLILPARSGRIDIEAFCVEQGRWRPRGDEKADRFTSADENAASPALRAAANANLSPSTAAGAGGSARDAQGRVWGEVAAAQEKLAKVAGGDVRRADSPSSYQLTVEHEKVAALREGYVKELAGALEKYPSATGVAFAVSGKVVSVDVYATPDLLRGMYPRLLKGVAVWAAGEPPATGSGLATEADILALLDCADDGLPEVRNLPPRTRVLTRRSAGAAMTETYDTARPELAAVHRVVLAVTSSDDAGEAPAVRREWGRRR